MIISREFLPEDVPGIDEIFQKQKDFGIPSLENVIVNSTLADAETGKIVGYGAVKIFAEAIVLIDQDLRKRDKVRALREGMLTALLICKDAGLEYLYAITNSENFSKVLRKSYRFKRVPGETLMLNLKEN